jgi:CDP-diacylglycerol--inositol 3-phosphatidyltransferase
LLVWKNLFILCRISTLGLLIILAMFYNHISMFIQLLAFLDISSHWFQMYSTLACGEQNHKAMTDNILLKIYYTNRIVLFSLCAGNEVFLLSCYLQYFAIGPLVYLFGFYKGLYEVLFIFSLPFFVVKQFLNVIQLIMAVMRIANLDVEKRQRTIQVHWIWLQSLIGINEHII